MNKILVSPEEFVREFWLLKKDYPTSLLADNSPILEGIELTQEQRKVLPEVLDRVLTDVLYTILLGLDGAAQIGEKQVAYVLFDEQGNKICSEMGEVESIAYDYFHGEKQ